MDDAYIVIEWTPQGLKQRQVPGETDADGNPWMSFNDKDIRDFVRAELPEEDAEKIAYFLDKDVLAGEFITTNAKWMVVRL